METDHFYITYVDKARQSGRYPTDINLGALDNDEIAEKYILDYFTSNYQKYLWHDLENINGDLLIEVTPILITNDARLFLLYKGVFTPDDFKWYCRYYDSYQNLQFYEKLKVDKGRGTQEAFEHFERLISGEGRFAYEYIATEEWHDDSGNTRSADVESGWKIIPQCWINEDIKERYRL